MEVQIFGKVTGVSSYIGADAEFLLGAKTVILSQLEDRNEITFILEDDRAITIQLGKNLHVNRDEMHSLEGACIDEGN